MSASEECEAQGSGSGATFRIVKEELSYSRYLSVYNRVVEYPSVGEDKKVVEYDVVGSQNVSFKFCAVMPFDSRGKVVTLLKEYAQGANEILYSLPCGGLSKTHSSMEDCAMKELSEEAHLQGGKLIRLLPEDHPGILEIKWCRNRFTPFLVLDPEADSDPRPRDREEFIEIVTVELSKLKEIMYGGSMMLPSIVTCAMAIKYLEEHNLA